VTVSYAETVCTVCRCLLGVPRCTPCTHDSHPMPLSGEPNAGPEYRFSESSLVQFGALNSPEANQISSYSAKADRLDFLSNSTQARLRYTPPVTAPRSWLRAILYILFLFADKRIGGAFASSERRAEIAKVIEDVCQAETVCAVCGRSLGACRDAQHAHRTIGPCRSRARRTAGMDPRFRRFSSGFR
jgi:hypothetical protein